MSIREVDGPSLPVLESILVLRTHLACAVARVCNPGDADTSEPTRLLLRQFHDADAGVRGNRPPDLPISWGDVRRMLAASLRLCLEELES